jgi:hypothetical protein
MSVETNQDNPTIALPKIRAKEFSKVRKCNGQHMKMNDMTYHSVMMISCLICLLISCCPNHFSKSVHSPREELP